MTVPELPGSTLAVEDPARAAAQVAAFENASLTKFPDAPDIVDNFYELPMGLALPDGEVIASATVRELNGEDEEELARATKSKNYGHFLDVLLERGVAKLGDAKPTGKQLRDLTAGDRDFLVIAIRRATYGDTIDYAEVPCTNCGEPNDISVNLGEDIENVKIDPTKATFQVLLSNNRSALCRIPNGHDQEELGKLPPFPQTTTPEYNSVLIKQCVVEVTDLTTGRSQSMAAFPALSRKLSMKDRKKIVDKLNNSQPGPQYNDVKYTCPSCEQEVTISVNVGALFLL